MSANHTPGKTSSAGIFDDLGTMNASIVLDTSSLHAITNADESNPNNRPVAGAPSRLSSDMVSADQLERLFAAKGMDFLEKGSEDEVRKYINEHHEHLAEQLEEDVQHFVRLGRVNNFSKMMTRVNGAAGELISRTQVFLYDLPGMPETAFVIPSGRIFFNADFYERLLNERKMQEEERKRTLPPHVPLDQAGNPIDKRSFIDPVEFILHHEAEHALRHHFTRFPGESPYMINIAGDMVINLSIQIDNALKSLLKERIDFALFSRDPESGRETRDKNGWIKLREKIGEQLETMPPSIKLGIGFTLQDFDNYALSGTREVLMRMKEEMLKDTSGKDDPDRNVRIIDIMEGVAQDLERLAAHPAITARVVDERHPYDLTQLAPVLAEDVRRAGELMSNIPHAKNPHAPSPSEQAGVKPTFDPIATIEEFRDVTGRLLNYNGTPEYTIILDQDHLNLRMNNQPSANTGDKWVDNMKPSERLAQALKFMQAIINPSASADNSNQNSSRQTQIHNPFHKSLAQGKSSNTEEKQDQQGQNANPGKGKTDGQGRFDGNNKNSESLEKSLDENGQLPSIRLGDTCAAGAKTGTLPQEAPQHEMDTHSVRRALDDYKKALDVLGLNGGQGREDQFVSQQNTTGMRLAEESIKRNQKETADCLKRGDNNVQSAGGAHRDDCAYAQMQVYYKPVLSLEGMWTQMTDSMFQNSHLMTEGEQSESIMYSPSREMLFPGMGDDLFIAEQVFDKQGKGPTLGLIVDTSGSVDDEMLIRFMSEVRGFMESMQTLEPPPKIVLTSADTTARTLDLIKPEDVDRFLSQALAIGGRGGTDFTGSVISLMSQFAPDNKYENERLHAILYLTDGGDFPLNQEALDESARILEINKPPVIFLIPQDRADSAFLRECNNDGVSVVYFDRHALSSNGLTLSIDVQAILQEAEEKREIDDKPKNDEPPKKTRRRALSQ